MLDKILKIQKAQLNAAFAKSKYFGLDLSVGIHFNEEETSVMFVNRSELELEIYFNDKTSEKMKLFDLVHAYSTLLCEKSLSPEMFNLENLYFRFTEARK